MLAGQDENREGNPSFFDKPNVKVEMLPYGEGVPIGIEQVSNPQVGIGGAYGTWGQSFDNQELPRLIEQRLGSPLDQSMRLNLAELGFNRRHHVPPLSPDQHYELEVEVGARFLQAAADANGWATGDVDAVVLGVSGPASEDFTQVVAKKAGIPEGALKLSVHKACDSSVAGLHMALNPLLSIHRRMGLNLAEELQGKKVLVGGIEGLSRFLIVSRDSNAVQLFGNGAGVIGVVPGKSMRFLAGATHEAYDEEGVLQVRMFYPHSRERRADLPLAEASQSGRNHYRVAGLMHEPESDAPLVMAGPMGMVKLFVRTGVQTVQEAYAAYRQRMEALHTSNHELRVAIVHHANFKINQLKEKHLQKEGIRIPMPWLLDEFGNVERGVKHDRLPAPAAEPARRRPRPDRRIWGGDLL